MDPESDTTARRCDWCHIYFEGDSFKISTEPGSIEVLFVGHTLLCVNLTNRVPVVFLYCRKIVQGWLRSLPPSPEF
jgi:hypothetical protein